LAAQDGIWRYAAGCCGRPRIEHKYTNDTLSIRVFVLSFVDGVLVAQDGIWRYAAGVLAAQDGILRYAAGVLAAQDGIWRYDAERKRQSPGKRAEPVAGDCLFCMPRGAGELDFFQAQDFVYAAQEFFGAKGFGDVIVYFGDV
jgi:hypothetical protein